MTALTDIDRMPFGKFKGTPMQDVPTEYLHYLWVNGKKHEVETSNVAAYINNSLSALKQENPDLIW